MSREDSARRRYLSAASSDFLISGITPGGVTLALNFFLLFCEAQQVFSLPAFLISSGSLFSCSVQKLLINRSRFPSAILNLYIWTNFIKYHISWQFNKGRLLLLFNQVLQKTFYLFSENS
jgi:hypothetical protein